MAQPCTLVEERVTGRVKGTAIRGMVPISSGTLSATSDRLLFHGDRKSLAIPLAKLAGYSASPGTLVLSREGSQHTMNLRIPDPELAVALLSALAKRGS